MTDTPTPELVSGRGAAAELTALVGAVVHGPTQPAVDAPLFERVNTALDFALTYGSIDGDHHKMWVIDQIVRALTGPAYEAFIAAACEGADGPDTYEWDPGMPP